MNTETIKLALEKRLKELTTRTHEIDKELGEEPDDDWSENATESEGDEVLERVGDMALREIQQIRRALSRIKAETYGVCEGCDGKIAIKRLDAVPYATRCVRCAEGLGAG